MRTPEQLKAIIKEIRIYITVLRYFYECIGNDLGFYNEIEFSSHINVTFDSLIKIINEYEDKLKN